MELSELYKGFIDLIGDSDLIHAVYDILMSDKKDEVFLQYIEMVNGDLETDYLQQIFQYYYADRKEKCQDYTPKSISKLCARLTNTNGNVVYDLCAGSGALTIQKWLENKEKTFVCEELDKSVIPFLLFNMAVRNMKGYVINRNALTMNCGCVFQVLPGDRFSSIEAQEKIPEFVADEIVSNPPYNIRWNPPAPLLADSRFSGKPIPPESNANFAFVFTALSRMNKNGKCAFVLPNGALTKENENGIRKYLVDSGLIESIIALPDGMFEATSIPTCILVFSQGNKSVDFFDLRGEAVQMQRDQRGQFGGSSHEKRVYHKNINVISDETIGYILNKSENIKEIHEKINREEIELNSYILSPSRYIKPRIEETNHRPFQDIMADINRISRERSIIRITCNEKYAKELGIYEVAELQNACKPDELSKTFEILGGRYESKPYIKLTKSKEFIVENQDKEILSSMIPFFLQMWKQHVFYLNQEENRLLSELRDALLPELMSGKLNV